MSGHEVLVASNRGPLAFRFGVGGHPVDHRGGGGLVSALTGLGPRTLWVCAAIGDADRQVARESPGGRIDLADHDTGGPAVRMIELDPGTYERAYSRVANSCLWFAHHLLWDSATTPVHDAAFFRAWDSYVDYNEVFADVLAQEAAPGGRVVVQDYHLALVPAMLRERRPDLAIGHFTHTPFATPDVLRMLPDQVSSQLLRGILGADHAGFHSPRWAQAFRDCCAQLLGARCDGAAVTGSDGRRTTTGVHPLGVEPGVLRARAAATDVAQRRADLAEAIAGRLVVARVDRLELSKNVVRGLLAYAELLRTWPQWRERVVHVIVAYPSRADLPEYRAYSAEVQRVARAVDDEFGRPGWEPVLLATDDDFPRSLAAYQVADVLIVNPVRDGMNLVAKEGPVVSDRGLSLVLSREAGATDELGEAALVVNPYDVVGTARALHEALSMPPAERARRCARLVELATALPPRDWFASQLAALPPAGRLHVPPGGRAGR